jgi:tRNA-modifying protein YgfZ
MVSLQLVDLSDYSAIDIDGIDASKFLQGQITINIDTPTNLQSCLAALCNPKGRIISLFHIAKTELGFHLIMPKSLIEITLNHLKKYAVFYKVDITQNTGLSLIGAIGNSPEAPHAVSCLGLSSYQLNLLPLWFIGLTEEHCPKEIATKLNAKLTTDIQVWLTALAANKTCWITEQTSGLFLPHNLALPELQAVDFKKGCFTGQEVIARMQYKGKLKQHLHILRSKKAISNSEQLLTAPPNPKLLQHEKSVGELICHCVSEQKRWTVLALVKDSAINQQNFTVNLENSPILEVVE